MGFVMANHGLYTLLTSAVSGATDLRCLVLTDVGSPTDAQLEDLNFVADIFALGLVEATNVNYARQDLAGVAVVEDDVNNKVVLSATAPQIIDVASGGVWKRVAYYVEGASDADRPVIGVDTPTLTITPNGGDITLPTLLINVMDVSP